LCEYARTLPALMIFVRPNKVAEYCRFLQHVSDNVVVVPLPESIALDKLRNEHSWPSSVNERVATMEDGMCGYARMYAQLVADELGIALANMLDDNVKSCYALNADDTSGGRPKPIATSLGSALYRMALCFSSPSELPEETKVCLFHLVSFL
jgi:hypothetical protein